MDKDDKDVERKIVFVVSESDSGVPAVVLGIPEGAWQYIRDGHTQTFDFTKVGIPLQLVVFGATTHEAAHAALFRSAGPNVVDMRSHDFSIPEKK
jgi:hypothetical protein